MDSIIKSLDILREDLSEEQLQKLAKIATELKDPTKITMQDAMKIVEETGIDIEAMQRKMGRIRAEAVKNRPPKIGVNEQCPCGSGKKYKKCCRK